MDLKYLQGSPVTPHKKPNEKNQDGLVCEGMASGMKSLLKTRQVLKRLFVFMRTVFLLSAGRFVVPRKRSGIPSKPVKILVISQTRLGDAVLSVPLLTVLHDRFPSAQIHVLANRYIREVYEMCPHTTGIMELESVFGPLDWAHDIRRIRREKFDWVIDLNTDGSLMPAVAAGYSAAPCRIGYGQDGRRIFFDAALPFPKEGRHMVDLILGTLVPLGLSRDRPGFDLVIPKAEERDTAAMLERIGVKRGRPVVGIHPGGVHPTQRWPAENFADLSDLILRSGEAQVLLLGGPKDQILLSEIVNRMQGAPIQFPPVTRIKGLAALLNNLNLLVCNNSGPLHLASALSIPTISFMGPTLAEQWRPVGEGNTVLRRDDLDCIGCNMGICPVKTHACMYGISPTEVFETIRNRLAQDSKILSS